jgi:hypothetical protein
MAPALVVYLGGATDGDPQSHVRRLQAVDIEGGLGLWMLRPGWLLCYASLRLRARAPSPVSVALSSARGVACSGGQQPRHRPRLWPEGLGRLPNVSPLMLLGMLMGLGMLVFPPVVRCVTRARDRPLSP